MSRKRSWRRLCKFCVAGLLGFVLLAVLLVFTKYITHQCTEQEARDALRELCEEYARNRATGNLCPDLCTAHSIIFRECLNYRKGKKVMLAEWNTKKVILKSQYSRLQEYNSMIAKYTNEEGKVVTSQPDMATFLMVVKNQLRTTFQEDAAFNTVRETVRKMWNMPWKSHETMSVAAMESLWALLQQEEYLLMQYFKGNKHFPKIYGSCGHFYVMEYTPTGDTLSPQLFSHKTVEGIFKSGTDWEDRAKLALSFLTFIEDLDTFYTEPLHLCDVKSKNYGVSEDLTIRAIDVDMAFFETKMRGILRERGNCTKNEDCDFVDCTSSCDLTRGRCSEHRSNSNLQAICKKIFMGSNRRLFGGLLRSPPATVAERLKEALQECVEPSKRDNQSRRASSKTLKAIRVVLQESIQSKEPKT